MNNSTEDTREPADKGIPASPTLIGFGILLSTDPESVIVWLQELTSKASSVAHTYGSIRGQEAASEETPVDDSWLSHAQAAKYLGLSTSTLYRHAGQKRLESRKFGGRLQYRTSTLERYQNQQLRPARG